MLTLLGRLLLLSGLVFAAAGYTEEPALDEQRYVADIEFQTAEEFSLMLQRADQLLVEGMASQDGAAKITFLVHGPGVNVLLRQNYLENKATVDLAARLTALGVVDIKACQSWMGGRGIDSAQLQPFVETVPYAPRELDRLVKDQNSIYF